MPTLLELQEHIYTFVLQKLQADSFTCSDAKHLAKTTDEFWVSEFDDVLVAFEQNEQVFSAVECAIYEVLTVIEDYYADPLNNLSGKKTVVTFADITDADIISVVNSIQPGYITDDEAGAELVKQAMLVNVSHAELEGLAKAVLQHDGAGWDSFFTMLAPEYVPPSISEADVKLVKNGTELRALFLRKLPAHEYVEAVYENMLNLTAVPELNIELLLTVSQEPPLAIKFLKLITGKV